MAKARRADTFERRLKMSTHQQPLYHIVFSTKNRQPWLTDGFREKVFAYLAGTTKQLGGFPLHEVEYDPRYLWD